MISTDLAIAGNVDLIPARISQIPRIIKSKRIPISVAMVQITPPNDAGYCSLGVAVDVAREAMQEASLVVGEINHQIPFTFGDTMVSISDFDLLVESTEPPIYFKRWPVSKVINQVAANIAQVIEDGDCISFFTGSLFEALGLHLIHKRHLGIHSSYFTDALMDLVKSGAVTNYRKGIFRGKTVASYALGTPALMKWLDFNPLVEFHGIEKVFDPTQIGRNPNVVVVDRARKVDLLGRIAFRAGKGDIISGPGQAADLITGAEISRGGRTVIGLPSQNSKGDPNVGDVGFVVEEKYQGLGIATYLYEMLIRLAKERGLKGFTAEVLQTNKAMMKAFEKGHLPITARLRDGLYRLKISFDIHADQPENKKNWTR